MTKPVVKIGNYEAIVRRIQQIGGNLDARKFTANCATHHLQAMRPRIMSGRNRDGGKFAPYSTNPMYVSKSSMPGLRSYIRPRGKTGRTRFQSGKRLKSQYFKQGYAEFRRQMGLSNRNRLSLRGKMLESLTVTNYGREGSQIVFSRREENLKGLGNEARYRYWGFTDRERKSNLSYADRLFQDYIETEATK